MPYNFSEAAIGEGDRVFKDPKTTIKVEVNLWTTCYKRKFNCSKDKLIDQFNITFERMNVMSKEMKLLKKSQTSQKVMRQEFRKYNEMLHGDVFKLKSIMFSILPNTGWIEHAYSILELMGQPRQNRMAISTMKNLFFLGALKLEVKDTFS